MIKKVLFAIITILLFWAGSCSSYHIEGYIEADKTEANVNELVLLEAVVTDEVTPFDVLWCVETNADAASLISPVVFNSDTTAYKAMFSAREPGEYTISVTFLYKNTGPKPSDKINIKISDE
jgi:hypothetical protein